MEQKVIMAPDAGITKYLPNHLIDDRAWVDGNNVQFGAGFVKKADGWTPFLPTRSAWAASTSYTTSSYVVPSDTAMNKHVYRCTEPGISGDSEPVWPVTGGGTVVDGEVTWTEVGVSALTGILQAIDNYYRRDGFNWLMIITTRRAYYYSNETQTFVDITGETNLTGDDDHPVSTENAQDYFVFTNGVDPIKYWGGSGDIADLPGLTDCEPGPEGDTVTSVRAKCLLYWNNFLILGDTTENSYRKPQRIRWSMLGDITVWKNDTDGYGEAGAADLSEGVDWVQALRPLGSYLVVYKERSIQVLSYVGGDQIWDKRPAIIGTGLLAPRALCDLGDEHLFIGPDNFYSFDGIEPKIAGDAVAKEFFRLLVPSKSGWTTSFFIEEVPEAWFAFVSIDSEGGYHDRAVVYNSDTKAWSWRDAPMLAYGYFYKRSDMTIDSMEFAIDEWVAQIDSSTSLENAPVNIAGDVSGVIHELGGASFAGSDIVSSLTSKLFDLGDPGHIKRLLRIQLMISREGEGRVLPVYIKTCENVEDEVTEYGPYNMNLDRTFPPWIDLDLSARYFAIRLGTVKKNEPFKLTGLIFYYEVRGEA